MLRYLLPAIMLFGLTACDQKIETGTMAVSNPAPARALPAAAAPNQLSNFNRPGLAYTHHLTLEMPAASVTSHYERALKSCSTLSDQGCIILSASTNQGNSPNYTSPNAQLTVRLPHTNVATFRNDLLTPLPGEEASNVAIVSQSTNGEDLTKQIADVEQRATQLSDYRERLLVLSKRADAKVDDLIKIENELSSVQVQLETIAAAKSGLNERVDTEMLTIEFRSRASVQGAAGPIAQAWSQGGKTLGDSTARALSFAISALPWLPVAGIGLFLLRVIVRRRRK